MPSPKTSEPTDTTTAKIKLLRAHVHAKSSKIQSTSGKK